MTRETNDDTRLVFDNVFNDAGDFQSLDDVLINATDFEFDWEIGFDISVMRGDGYGGSHR